MRKMFIKFTAVGKYDIYCSFASDRLTIEQAQEAVTRTTEKLERDGHGFIIEEIPDPLHSSYEIKVACPNIIAVRLAEMIEREVAYVLIDAEIPWQAADTAEIIKTPKPSYSIPETTFDELMGSEVL